MHSLYAVAGQCRAMARRCPMTPSAVPSQRSPPILPGNYGSISAATSSTWPCATPTTTAAIRPFCEAVTRSPFPPLFDFAPMFLDPEGIGRVSRWEDEEPGRQPDWRAVIEKFEDILPPADAMTVVGRIRGEMVRHLPASDAGLPGRRGYHRTAFPLDRGSGRRTDRCRTPDVKDRKLVTGVVDHETPIGRTK